jgi:uncharacterized protein (DUF849 family)
MTPGEIAAAAAAAADAGAAMLHLHVRDAEGNHVLDADAYRTAISAVARSVGDRMIVQITTEAAGRYAPAEQMRTVREVRPESVSFALRELFPGPEWEAPFADFLAYLRRERIAPQVILYDREDVARLKRLSNGGFVPFASIPVLYVLGRYVEGGASGPADLLAFLEEGRDTFPDFMVCAFGRQEAACGVAAALLGGSIRVGFENNLLLPDGRRASDNSELVEAVVRPLRALGHRPEEASEWRQRLARLY